MRSEVEVPEGMLGLLAGQYHVSGPCKVNHVVQWLAARYRSTVRGGGGLRCTGTLLCFAFIGMPNYSNRGEAIKLWAYKCLQQLTEVEQTFTLNDAFYSVLIVYAVVNVR